MEAPISSSLGAMGPLLRKLKLLLAPEYPLRKSLKQTIELLKEDLEEVTAALVEQSMVDSPSNKAKYWMDEVRELSYHMEDCIDDMMRPQSATDAKIRSVQCHRVARLKIHRLPKIKPSTRAARIAEIKALLWEASERYERYQLDCCASNPSFALTGTHNRVSALCKTSADLVGVDEPRKELTKWLTNKEEKQLKVLSIIGPAGVGKTTLIGALYRELKGQFECRAFIRVSRKPDMSKLLGDIQSQVQGPKQTSDTDTSASQNSIDSIREHLQNKRYFIVIDDLWDATPWDILSSAFPKGNSCSRIIITAEFQDVTQWGGYRSVNVLEMKPLGSQDSEKLFLHRVFGSEHHCPDQLKELSCWILKACAGLPLAIITMASLLSCELYNTNLWNKLLRCFFPSLAILTLEEMLEKIVNLCYSRLPQYLKTCLLYLDIYPEGSTIWKVDLLKQWIAEGFVSRGEGKEGVAESYFDELVNRGMIHPEKTNHSDEVLSCTVHHSIRDLIRHRSSEEKFITAIDYSQAITGFHMMAHRLSLHFSSEMYVSKPEGMTLSQVRSLAFFGLHRCMPSIIKFKHLRVLNVELWGDYDDSTTLNLSGLSRLFQLRYLKVSSHIVVELPSRIQELQFLETLEIDAKVSDIPNDIGHLPSLLHLSLRDGTKLPDGIGSITSLQTLQYFDLGKNSEDNVRSLGELINLQYLCLTYSESSSDEHLKRNLLALSPSLGRLVKLRSLILAPGTVGKTVFIHQSYGMSIIPDFLQRLELSSPICTFSEFPKWIATLQNLQILKIIVRVLVQNDIDILAALPVLTSLSLFVRRPNSESVVFHSGAFPVLKYFKYICGALCLVFKEKALPNLERLKVGFNVHSGEQYANMVSGIEYLFNLKNVAVEIGAAAGADESDRRSAEYAFLYAIFKHPRFRYFTNIKSVDWIEEEEMVRLPITAPEVRSKKEKMVVVAQDITDWLASSGNSFQYMNKISTPSGFDHRISIITEPEGEEAQGQEYELDPYEEWDAAVRLIEQWELPEAVYRLVFDSPMDTKEYLAAVTCLMGTPGPRAEAALRAAMLRLSKEFRNLLIHGILPLEADDMLALTVLQVTNSSSTGQDSSSLFSTSTGGEMSFFGHEISHYLISEDTVDTLRDIVNIMLRAGYALELCQVYAEVRSGKLKECLAVLGVDKMSLKVVQMAEWKILDGKIKKWIEALKVVVRSVLAEERRICSLILAADTNTVEECFTEAAKGCVLQLLNFIDATATGNISPEKLFRVLDAYVALAEVLPELEALFSGEARAFIKEEAEKTHMRLGDAVRGTIAEFSRTIQEEASRRLMPSGVIHPMTRYVMNYLILLVDYKASLNNLLQYFDTHMNAVADNTNMTPLGSCMLMLSTQLQVKIEEKSRLYEDEGLRSIFFMNNLLYMLQKVKDSELKTFLGDNWISICSNQIRQYSMRYLRSSWTKVLACLTDDGLSQTMGSSRAVKAKVKDRFKNFNVEFEELYRIQTSWCVVDPQLKEELKISISEKVIPAYRSFVERFQGQLEGGKTSSRYIGYNPEYLENMISDLFEGREPLQEI